MQINLFIQTVPKLQLGPVPTDSLYAKMDACQNKIITPTFRCEKVTGRRVRHWDGHSAIQDNAFLRQLS